MHFLTRPKSDILINQLDNLLDRVKGYVKQQHADTEAHWDLDFHVYGKGQGTPLGPGEVCMIIEAVAPTQELATSLVSTARIAMIVSSRYARRLGKKI